MGECVRWIPPQYQFSDQFFFLFLFALEMLTDVKCWGYAIFDVNNKRNTESNSKRPCETIAFKELKKFVI